MFNKFNRIMEKAMKAYSLTTPAQKLAFRTFVAEACLELDTLPTQAMLDEAAAYAHRVAMAEEEISFNIMEGGEPYYGDQLTVLNEYRPGWEDVETSTDAVRAWIDWYGLRK
ncbi:MAG: hypothetical protein Q4B32_08520 [Clostridia bacterium]|nr:hypothetical protein [Clostridia bacterium]